MQAFVIERQIFLDRSKICKIVVIRCASVQLVKRVRDERRRERETKSSRTTEKAGSIAGEGLEGRVIKRLAG